MSAVKKGLIDPEEDVREAAALAFDHLVRKAGAEVVDEVLPEMLSQVSGEEAEGGAALAGLRQLIAVRGQQVLPLLVPRLLTEPVTPFKANALSSLSTVAGSALYPHLQLILEALCPLSVVAESEKDTVSEETKEQAEAAQSAVRSVLLSVQADGLHLVMHEFGTIFCRTDSVEVGRAEEALWSPCVPSSIFFFFSSTSHSSFTM